MTGAIKSYGYKCPQCEGATYHYLEEGASMRYYCDGCGRVWKIEEVTNLKDLREPKDIKEGA